MTEERWAVIGIHGLYVGQYLTRRAAIIDHTCALYPTLDTDKAWHLCRKKGDKVVRVKISWKTK